MVSKTKEKIRQSKKHKHKRGIQTKKNKVTHNDHASVATAASATPAHMIESHRFMSSMTFDGNTLTTKTQKDNEPVIEHRYTKEQLAREIPIGKEMVDMYLDGKMPKELQQHHCNRAHRIDEKRSPVFQNVLISPADLGLLPPRSTNDEDLDEFMRQGRRQTKKLRMKRLEKRNRINNNHDDDTGLEMIINENNKKNTYLTYHEVHA